MKLSLLSDVLLNVINVSTFMHTHTDVRFRRKKEGKWKENHPTR